MRRKYKDFDPKEFADAEDDFTTTIKGSMRKHYLEIDRKLKVGGWTARKVVDWFNNQGYLITVELFRVYLRDLDREYGYKRSTNEYVNSVPEKKSKSKVTMQAEKSSDLKPSVPNYEINKIPKEVTSRNENQTIKLADKPKTFEHDPSPDKDNLL